MSLRRPDLPRIQLVSVPKRGHSEEENEDAAAFDLGRPTIRAAVADGATESIFSRTWAECIVSGFVASDVQAPEDVADAVARWRDEWERRVAARMPSRPWYVAEAMEEGAYAAFIGVTVAPDGSLSAYAVGDCCILVPDASGGVVSWPVAHAEAFARRPILLPSRNVVPRIEFVRIDRRGGGPVILATDAAAGWLLRHGLDAVVGRSEHAIEQRVREARRKRAMRNDDVTVLVMDLPT